jgi:hypothetical protein
MRVRALFAPGTYLAMQPWRHLDYSTDAVQILPYATAQWWQPGAARQGLRFLQFQLLTVAPVAGPGHPRATHKGDD